MLNERPDTSTAPDPIIMDWSIPVFETDGIHANTPPDGGKIMSGTVKKIEPTTIARQVDWTKCSAVHRIPGRVGGAWIVKGTRIPVDAVIQNYNAGYSVEQLSSEVFEGLPPDLAREIIVYATKGR